MKLQTYFDKFCVNFHKFCKRANIAPNTVKKAASGECVRLSSLKKITNHCNGFVSLNDFSEKHTIEKIKAAEIKNLTGKY